uniref:NACHT domain-containing protein n=1 Tax=Daphnia galeata TaxID=27404 RepID=A0A8J2RQH4_9CRUS|nr:unnamed protein product [Daphnia galeata]
MPKRQNQNSGDEPTRSVKKSRMVPGNTSTTENPLPPCGLKNSLHGNVFQLKLLMLFLIRGIVAGYQFELGTEIPGMGGKFDDLIFKFKKAKNINEASSTEEQIERYRFLQAKHKQNEETEKITAADLLKDNDGEFSLPKYFRSYFRDIIQGIKGCLVENVHDCIICTNIGFDNEDDLRKDGIELIPLDDHDIFLSFDNKVSARYKLKKTVQLCQKMAGWSEIHLLAKTLLDWVYDNNPDNTQDKKDKKTKKMTLKCVIFKSYHWILVKEKVIDREQRVTNEKKKRKKGEGLYYGKLNEDFLDGTNLTGNVNEFRQILSDFTFEKNKNKETKDSVEVRESVFQEFWGNKSFELSESFGTKDDQSPDETKKSLDCAIRDEDITSFLNKLVFVVHTPNEVELDSILKSEVGKYYELHESDFQSDFILRKMLDWFKKKESTFMTSEERKSIFKEGEKKMKSLRVTAVSIDYQKKLKKVLEFNKEAIGEMKEKLERLLASPNKIGHIATQLPKRTAVKVIASLDKFKSEQPTTKILEEYFQCEDSYLLTSLSNLRNKSKSFKETLQSEISHNLLIVVGDVDYTIEDGRLLQDITSSDSLKLKKRILVILDVNKNPVSSTSHRERDDYSSNNVEKDELKFSYLSEKTKCVLMSLEILFQGQSETLIDLIGKKEDNMLDKEIGCFAIEELLNLAEEKLNEEKSIKIPSCDICQFEQSLYIKRRLRFPFDGQFELGGECRISPDGHIEWFVKKKERKEVWKKIMDKITKQANNTGENIDENQLMNSIENKEKERSVVIISGVAGSGKSTILSSYYQEIKKAKPDHWVIRINLVDHYESILKMGNATRSDAVDFIVNQLHVVDDKSSFSRSLLRNRLETGDRIVFLFDGFDEINDECQEKAIQLMKAITKEKSFPLYVTTRTHMLDKLQFEFSQLAYILENFTKNDQIDYLVNYWKNKLSLEEKYDGLLQQFAESLIDRVSKTLNDQEKSFIGIPLQCRILAECFQSNIKELLELNDEELNGPEEFLEDKVSSLLESQKFDLLSLYDRLIETKRRVFREEKANATDSNQIVGDAIDYLILNIENHQTKLAIETIVTDKKIAEVLLPPHESSHRSDEEVNNEENRIASNGLKFGLTFKSKDDAKIQFLHRTYAEYLFAKYLYKGFLLDDKRHNKLLENALSRKIIVDQILAMKQYDGVQTFFDYLLKGLVDKDKEWRDRIIKRDLPNRLNKFTENLFSQFLRRSPPLNEFGTGMTIKSYFVNTLYFSLTNGKDKIFEFLCDCLDATFDKQQVLAVLMSFFTQSYISFTFFCNKESKLFKRFINYFDSNQFASKRIFSQLIQYTNTLPPCGLEYSQWNGEEQQKMLKHFLQFLEDNRESFDRLLVPNGSFQINPMLTLFIFNKNYDYHLKKFLRLLSRSTAFSDDSKFANLLEEAFCSKKHYIMGRIEKVLIILPELKRQNLLNQLYAVVLAIEPEAFQNIYQPLPLVGEDVTALDLNILMERDSYGMTRLHRAAFHGDTESVEKILQNIRRNLSQENETEKVANIMAWDEYSFTPFYFAAAMGKEEIYHQMLTFLKETLPLDALDEHFMDTKGFIQYALSNAIKSENIQMFKLILNAIKRVLGQHYLISFLKPHGKTSPFPSTSSFLVKCKTKELFNAMAKIVVMKDDNSDSDYTDLYDLVFYDDATKRTLQYIDAENIQGLLLLKGTDVFTKSVLDYFDSIYLSQAFQLISNHLLQHFTKDQLEQFVETIVSKNNTTKIRSNNTTTVNSHLVDFFAQSFLDEGWTREDLVFEDEGDGMTTIHAERIVPICYWENFIKSALTSNYEDGRLTSREDVHCIFNCLKYVGDSSAKKLFLHKDDNGFIMIKLSQTIVKLMLKHLTKESQEEVKQQWRNKAPPMSSFFPTAFAKPTSIRFAHSYSDILRFYLNYGSENHLNEFTNVVTSLRNIAEHDEVEFSVWAMELRI